MVLFKQNFRGELAICEISFVLFVALLVVLAGNFNASAQSQFDGSRHSVRSAGALVPDAKVTYAPSPLT